jgi:hypothetical protein
MLLEPKNYPFKALELMLDQVSSSKHNLNQKFLTLCGGYIILLYFFFGNEDKNISKLCFICPSSEPNERLVEELSAIF